MSNFYRSLYDIILIGRVFLKELFSIGYTIPFFKEKILNIIFAER